MRRSLLTMMLLLGAAAQADDGARVPVGSFSRGSLEQWEEKSFVGHTRYELVDSKRGRVLAARADATASGLFRQIAVDLVKTPHLNWSWKVENVFKGNDERSKQGDDYPARVYVVVSGGLFFWNTRAINYVWSSNQTKGSRWPNAFTENARMLAVESGEGLMGQWVNEKRNVRADFRMLFGDDIESIDAVAVMVDADNTKQSASAVFGDIWFSAN